MFGVALELAGSIILAEEATQVTGVCSQGDNLRTGSKVIQGFFLDGINSQTHVLSIVDGNQLATLAFSPSAFTRLSCFKVTVMWAEIANHPALPHFAVEHCFS